MSKYEIPNNKYRYRTKWYNSVIKTQQIKKLSLYVYIPHFVYHNNHVISFPGIIKDGDFEGITELIIMPGINPRLHILPKSLCILYIMNIRYNKAFTQGVLHDNIKELYLPDSFNKFHDSHFPKSMDILSIYINKLCQLILPNKLYHLILRCNLEIGIIPQHLYPNNLESVTLYSNSQNIDMAQLPVTVRSITIISSKYGNNFVINNIHDDIHYLDIQPSCQVTILPKNLHTLKIYSYINQQAISKLRRLYHLELYYTKMSCLNKLPISLKFLLLNNSGGRINNLPYGLRNISMMPHCKFIRINLPYKKRINYNIKSYNYDTQYCKLPFKYIII